MPEARFTTGEFADLCGTTKATLFHYDRLGVLKPRRDPDNNYRYYTDKQIADFDAIASLTEIGTPLAEIRELRENWDQDRYLQLLDRKEKEMLEREERLRDMRVFLRFVREEAQRYIHIRGDELEFVQLPAQRFAVGPGGDLDARERRRFYQGTQESIRQNRRQKCVDAICVGCIMRKEDLDKGRYLPSYYYCHEQNESITGQTIERPAGTYACFYHIGDRQGVSFRIRDALEEIRAQGWRVAGDLYMDDHLNVLPCFGPGRIVFPICVQVEKE